MASKTELVLREIRSGRATPRDFSRKKSSLASAGVDVALIEQKLASDKSISQSKLFSFLQQVNRPGFGGLSAVRNVLRASKGEEELDPIAAFQRGVTLEEKPIGKEVLREAGFGRGLASLGIAPESRAGKVIETGAGFGLDVFTDPLTFIPGAAIAKAGRGVKKITGISALGRQVRKTKPVQALGEAFVPFFKVKNLPADKAQKFIQSARKFEATVRNREQDIIRDTLELAKGVAPDQRKLIVDFLETGDETIRATLSQQGILGKAETVREKLAAFADVEQRHGILSNVIDSYFPHIKKGSRSGGVQRQPLRFNFQFGKHRKLEGTIGEIEEKFGTEFFERDAFKGLGIRGLAHARATSVHEFVGETLSNFGRKINLPKLKKGAIELGENEGIYMPKGNLRFIPREIVSPEALADLKNPGQLLLLDPKDVQKVLTVSKNVEAYAMPIEIAEALNNWRATFTNERATRGFLRMFDSVQNLWKGWSTAANFAFHGRNYISNYWLNFLRHGVRTFDPVANTEAARVLWSGNAKLRRAFPQILTDDHLKIFNKAKEQGIVNRGWIGADIPTLIERELDVGLATKAMRGANLVNPVSQGNLLLKGGRVLGENVENHARVLSFMLGVQRGETAVQSAQLTKKFLFDYGELAPFERNVMKRLIPFYTWMRKNIPLQFEQFLTQPGKYTSVLKAKQEIESGTKVPTAMPDWIRQSVPIFGGETPEGKKQAFRLEQFLPVADVEKVIGTSKIGDFRAPKIARTFLTSVSPIIKNPLEQLLNFDVFYNRPIERFPGQSVQVFGQPVRNRVARELPRPVGELQEVLGFQRFPGQQLASKQARYVDFFVGLKANAIDEGRQRRFQIKAKEKEVNRLRFFMIQALRKGDKDNATKARQLMIEAIRKPLEAF